MFRRRSQRTGFTLIEVMVALSISVLLLGALYVALSVQMHQMRSGREIIELNAVARSLLSRISNDIACHLAPVDPRVVSAEAIQEAAGGAAASAESSDASTDKDAASDNSAEKTDDSKSTSTSTDSSAKDSSGEMSSSESDISDAAALFNLGVQGDSTSLHLYITQGPKDIDRSATTSVSDLRRVSWWLAGTPEEPLGLARYEAKLATSGDGLTTQLPLDATPYIVSRDVVDLSFEYFDGTVWTPAWDGRTLMADGKTPLGPPAAVAINMTIASPALQSGAVRQSTVRHVVFLPAANGVGSSTGGLLP